MLLCGGNAKGSLLNLEEMAAAAMSLAIVQQRGQKRGYYPIWQELENQQRLLILPHEFGPCYMLIAF